MYDPKSYVTLALGNTLPVTVTLAPTFKLPPMPAPPMTTNAPVVVSVLAALLAATMLP